MNNQSTNIKLSPVNLEERRKLGFRAGDTVKVWSKIQEKGKTRLQAFEGMVLARKHGAETGASFTVRKVASGVGVEKIFPLYSPSIDKIEITKKAKVRRSKLYYIRDKVMKEIRRKIRSSRFIAPEPEVKETKEEISPQAEESPKEAEVKTPEIENSEVKTEEKIEEVKEEIEKEKVEEK